jgi:uncharacterized protein (UPF0276 family)
VKFACNYSPVLIGLIATGEAPVDYIKAGAFEPFESKLDGMRALRPVLLHGLGSHERTGMPGYETYDFARANRLLAAYGSPHLGIHIAITNADAAPGMDSGAILRRMSECARVFMQNIAVPLLLENIGDTPEERNHFDLVPFAEPERIGRLIRETGAGMLLDIAHAKVSAQYRKQDVREYLLALPLREVREIHVSGPDFDEDGNPYDAHGPMRDEDFALLEWALGRTEPDIVTLEYGWPEAEEDMLRKQLKMLHSILAERK